MTSVNRKKADLKNWDPKYQNKEQEPNLLWSSNRTLWTVIGGGLVIALVLVISFFTVAHFFPTHFFFGSKDMAGTINKKKVTLSEYRYYLIQAAQQLSYTSSDYEDKKKTKAVETLAWEMVWEDRVAPILAKKLEIIPQAPIIAKRNLELNEYETARSTPKFGYQLKSRGLTETLWRDLIIAESAKEMLMDYYYEQEDRAKVTELAYSLYEKSYVKVKWLRFSYTKSSGEFLSEEEKEKLRTKCYGISQQIQSGTSFEELRDSLKGDEQVLIYDQLVTKGQLQKPLEEEVFSLELEQIGVPVETEYGIFLMKRVDASQDYPDQEQAMLTLAREQLFDQWLNTFEKDYPVKRYWKNLNQIVLPDLLEEYYEEKKAADVQIKYMEKSQ